MSSSSSPSSSSSTSSYNGSVYLRLDSWYDIDLSDDTKLHKHVISKPNGDTTCAAVIRPLSEIKSVSWSGALVVDPFIYIAGGKGYTKAVSRYDIRSGECVPCPPMIVERQEPLVAVWGKKLFVMGGNKDDNDEEWAEVLDKPSGEWELLPPPHVVPARESLFYAIDNQRNLILVGNQEDMYSFHMPTQAWQLFDEYVYCDLLGEAIVVDKIIYYWSRGKIHYYNTDTRDRFEATITGLKEEGCVNTWDCMGHKLFHLHGDRFCMVWMDLKSYTCDDCQYTRVLFTRIQASLLMNEDGGASFTASVEYSQSYLAADDADIVGHVFLSDQRLKENLVEDRAFGEAYYEVKAQSNHLPL